MDEAARQALTSRLTGIYAIVNQSDATLEIARAALSAGVRILQYRAKSGIVAEDLRALRALTRERDAALVMNDDWHAALTFECDGVHLGPDDERFHDIATVRAALGPGLIGASCGTAQEARAAQAMGVDYVGVGAVFPTASKGDAGAPLGIGGLARVAAATTLPVAAIGGIDASNIARVRATGVAMAAVISAIADASDRQRAAAELVSLWGSR
ncbi:MAG TPA: thiamine phosphate synthase [Verrucomicrobiae bacterium]|jgi:thiamine-phosphate pyrophosphorylase|nr:thiamine phosphate synthase [Verrucomicrobiae bacterium]